MKEVCVAVVIGLIAGFAASDYRAAKSAASEYKDRVIQLEKQLDECRAKKAGAPVGGAPGDER